jgi:hypothetical protein
MSNELDPIWLGKGVLKYLCSPWYISRYLLNCTAKFISQKHDVYQTVFNIIVATEPKK